MKAIKSASVGAIAASLVTVAALSGTPMKPAQLFARVSPAVVSIKTYTLARDAFSAGAASPVASGVGSGFVIDSTQGLVITNGHVVNGSDVAGADLVFADESVHPASLVGIDYLRDIAVLKYDASSGGKRGQLKLCSVEPYVGESVAAFGSPFGLDHSISTGIISGKGRSIDGGPNQESIVNILQTDAAINPGNSGGPIVDAATGCVVGVNMAMIGPGVGLAIPADDVRESYAFVMSSANPVEAGMTRVGRLGFELMPDAYIEHLGVPGLPVITVLDGSIAQQLGFLGTHRDAYGMPQFGDIIMSVNGVPMKTSKDLKAILNKGPQNMEFQVLRDGKVRVVKLERTWKRNSKLVSLCLSPSLSRINP